MKYSYEFKRECIKLYRNGIKPETPEWISDKEFIKTVRTWDRTEEANGIDGLRHKNRNKEWSVEEKLEIVLKVIAGNSIKSVSCDVGINSGLLYHWLQKYKAMGYNGLINKTRGRPNKGSNMKKAKIKKPRAIHEPELEELIRLREENDYIKAENAIIKKAIALREEKQAALLKAKKRK